MSYITQIPLNSYRPETKKLLGSRQVAHATVEQSFPPILDDSAAGRVLWRIDREGANVSLIIVSPNKASVEHIVENCGWASSEVTHQQASYDELLASIENGEEYAFSVVVNPVTSVTGSKRRIAIDKEDVLDWASSKLSFAGNVRELNLVEYGQESFRRGEGRVTLVVARLTGIISISNAEETRKFLSNGIGRAKGYGCGLLTLDAKLT